MAKIVNTQDVPRLYSQKDDRFRYEAVKEKIPAQFHWIADMPHSMPWYPRQQRETLNLILDFLGTNCGQVSGAGA